MNSFSNTIHKYRRVDSPLPAVPLPAKSVTLSHNSKNTTTDTEKSTCPSNEDINRQKMHQEHGKKGLQTLSSAAGAAASQSKLVNIGSKSQTNYNMACKFTVDDDPLLVYEDANPKPLRNHDYEEFADDRRQVPNNAKSTSQSLNHHSGTIGKSHNPSPCKNENNVTSPTNVASSMERQNPMYAGYDPPKCPESQSASDESDSENAIYGRNLSRKQRTKLFFLLIIVLTTCISIAALTTTILFAIGALSPSTSFENIESSRLKENIDILTLKTGQLSTDIKEKIEKVDRIIDDQNKTVDDLLSTVKNLSESSIGGLIKRREDTLNKSMLNGTKNSSEYQNLIAQYQNLLTDIKVKTSNCRHETFSIGSSSSQELTESGEYYADESFVITGVTCSSTAGYVSTLRSRSDQGKTKYKCICHRSEEGLTGIFGGRVECRIHYWQCPS